MSTLTPFTFPVTGEVELPAFPGEPRIQGLEGHLYVVEFDTGSIKVGYTADPETRIATHAKTASDFGQRAVRGILSAPHVEAELNERKLIGWCREAAGLPMTHRGEYFPIKLKAAAEFMATLPQTRGDKASFEKESKARLEGMKAFFGYVAGLRSARQSPEPIFQWASHLDPGDRAVFLNDLREAMETPDPLTELDHVVAKWRTSTYESQQNDEAAR